MAKNKVHFGNENKARSFAEERGGTFHQNHGNTEKPYTVSFPKDQVTNTERAYDFDSDINGNGTHWHTAEDL